MVDLEKLFAGGGGFGWGVAHGGFKGVSGYLEGLDTFAAVMQTCWKRVDWLLNAGLELVAGSGWKAADEDCPLGFVCSCYYLASSLDS